MTILALPPYPSSGARANLSASQLATLNQKIASSLQEVISLPPPKRDTPATAAFVSTYARDRAQSFLQSLIWPDSVKSSQSREEKTTHARVLQLAEKLAASGSLGIHVLLDLTIAYHSQTSRLRTLLSNAIASKPQLLTDLKGVVVPSFISLLNNPSSSGLYGFRKTSHCILSFLHASPPEFLLAFAHDRQFIISLATAYDFGLTSLAQSYGGLRLPPSDATQSRALDEWERVFLETKVALVDAFHIIFKKILEDLTKAETQGTPRDLAMESQRTFGIIFALLELPSSSATTASPSPPIPFLNRPLLADYQHAYDMSRLLENVVTSQSRDDGRLEVLTMSLRSLDDDSSAASSTPSSSNASKRSNPGALKLLLGSGVPPGIDNLGRRPAQPHTKPNPSLGLASTPRSFPPPVAPSSSAIRDDVKAKVSEVLSILPDYEPGYIKALLQRSEYAGNSERVVEALLEGTAPPPEAINTASRPVESSGRTETPQVKDEFEFTKERRNVFDEEAMDLSKVRVGKKSDEASVLRDRTFIEQMKADILRRAEEANYSDEEEEGKDVAFEEELDYIDTGAAVKVGGDGEESGEEDEEGEGDGVGAGESSGKGKEREKANPETILEMAYIRDAKVFERDAATRRGKDRVALRAQTGWDDSQIEGWHIMLERNPKQKEKLLQKYEFTGNHPVSEPPSRSQTPDGQSSRGGGSRGRGGRGRGGRGGGGGGRGRGGGGGGGNEQRDRAWKDKNKASRGNHDRKRGHDKKMSRAGGPS
ncbi:uncharacterized protein STEHIDRAFT_143565 [Stereum hirsutum FP-91666 SS1]|uniref:uncharacterized protein n=1 Tax=Stereum hirsutum (strain FP-91666) TaxID=721885 RepID=UPI000440FD86|nr:uncharacterized protein STEHIDRAFT_143565 [Stereum hirsutum FP-91666 SS1]EIM92125.1 hypothetical protein STEHIDRAFT_143565 [Stereum hirsutum FP-91666 SS1]